MSNGWHPITKRYLAAFIGEGVVGIILSLAFLWWADDAFTALMLALLSLFPLGWALWRVTKHGVEK